MRTPPFPIYLPPPLRAALDAEARRRGLRSTAALIRVILAAALGVSPDLGTRRPGPGRGHRGPRSAAP